MISYKVTAYLLTPHSSRSGTITCPSVRELPAERHRTDPKLVDKVRILYEDFDYTTVEDCIVGIGRRTSIKFLEEMNKAEHGAKEKPAPAAAFTENEF